MFLSFKQLLEILLTLSFEFLLLCSKAGPTTPDKWQVWLGCTFHTLQSHAVGQMWPFGPLWAPLPMFDTPTPHRCLAQTGKHLHLSGLWPLWSYTSQAVGENTDHRGTHRETKLPITKPHSRLRKAETWFHISERTHTHTDRHMKTGVMCLNQHEN